MFTIVSEEKPSPGIELAAGTDTKPFFFQRSFAAMRAIT